MESMKSKAQHRVGTHQLIPQCCCKNAKPQCWKGPWAKWSIRIYQSILSPWTTSPDRISLLPSLHLTSAHRGSLPFLSPACVMLVTGAETGLSRGQPNLQIFFPPASFSFFLPPSLPFLLLSLIQRKCNLRTQSNTVINFCKCA